ISGGPQAVDIYFNESPLNQTLAFKSLFDIGQIEVLRGPQGTLRGNTAPTGAITIATRRPKFNEWGATTDLTYSYRDDWGANVQAAVNVPLINDKLAIRIAGLYDRNDAGGTSNPVTGADARGTTKAIRASLLFKPFDALEIFGMYQYSVEDNFDLTRVDGPGIGYNGPVLSGNENR